MHRYGALKICIPVKNDGEMTYDVMWHRLVAAYGTHEAKAVSRYALEKMFGLTLTDIVCGAVEKLSSSDAARLEEATIRLEAGEPVQYVLGATEFLGRTFSVTPEVLIPRPETEEVCREAELMLDGIPSPSVLDIGTGSGCIAISLALDMPQAQVEAWDISHGALQVAVGNAATLNARVRFHRQDALNPPGDREIWNAIVSNPPYICLKEQAEMERNVLQYEPHKALFVPDESPLLFYSAIARYAAEALKPNGALLFEINQAYARETEDMLSQLRFSDVRTIKDRFGKDRITTCRKQQKR